MMYLVDTDVISESRKGPAANPGIRAFFTGAIRDESPLYISRAPLPDKPCD